MNPAWYAVVREVQLWACLVPTTLFLIGYLWYMRRRKFEPASWYILGWTITCEFAFVLSFVSRLFPGEMWVRYVGVVLGALVAVMSWAMLFMLLWVYRRQISQQLVENVERKHSPPVQTRMEGDPGYDASDHSG